MLALTDVHSPDVKRILWMLAALGRYANASTRILDFGCGSGHVVYAFRDAGFDAHGFDMHDHLELRDEADRIYFRISQSPQSASISDYRIDPGSYILPYDDNAFDLVLSSTVLEHIQDYDLVFSEIARVTKPGGVGIHTYPAKFTLLESHIHVPLGTVVRAHWWFWLWAKLGVRNKFQQEHTVREVADLNYRYARTGLSYPSPLEMQKMARRYFSPVEFRPDLWHQGGRLQSILTPIRYARCAYTFCRYCILITIK